MCNSVFMHERCPFLFDDDSGIRAVVLDSVMVLNASLKCWNCLILDISVSGLNLLILYSKGCPSYINGIGKWTVLNRSEILYIKKNTVKKATIWIVEVNRNAYLLLCTLKGTLQNAHYSKARVRVPLLRKMDTDQKIMKMEH